MARSGLPPLEVVARYRCQEAAERLIVLDIVRKVALRPTDDLLEIGCGPGNLLIPMAFICQSVAGVDHPDVLDMLTRRFAGPPAVRAISGNFLDLEIDDDFDVVLLYAMLHYLSTVEEAVTFVRKAAALLRPGGRMLIGDLPDASRKACFLATDEGQQFQRQWDEIRQNEPESSAEPIVDNQLIATFDDTSIAALVTGLEEDGLTVEILAQAPDLPFGHSRTDLLVHRATETR